MCNTCTPDNESVKFFTLQFRMTEESIWHPVTMGLHLSYPDSSVMTWAATLEIWQDHSRDTMDSMWPVFFTGKDAAQAKESVSIYWNDRTFRIMPHNAPMMRGNGESLASYMQKRDNWKARESARFETGFYEATPFKGESWFDEVHARLNHFLHVSRTDKTRVSFTESEEKGIADRQTAPMNIGRYFTRFAAEYGLTPERIASLSVQYSKVHGGAELAFKLAMTPDEIEAVYTMGEPNVYDQHSPTSCMSYAARRFSSSIHPTRVYGAGDLGVAYLLKGDRCTARALVWPAKKIYSRIYGDEERLAALLREAGYSDSSNLAGARLLKIQHRGQYVMPYIDGEADQVKHSACGKFFELVTHRGAFSAGNTNGLAGECSDYDDDDEDSCHCERCNRTVDADYTFYLEDISETWCERCYNAHAMTCESCQQTVRSDGAVRLASGDWICESCSGNTFVCGDDGEHYPDDENSGLENAEGESIAQCNAHRYFVCSQLQDDIARPIGDSYRTGELFAYEGESDDLPLSIAGYDEIIESGDEERIRNLETRPERAERLACQLSFMLVLESSGVHCANPSLDEIAAQVQSMQNGMPAPIDYNANTGQIVPARHGTYNDIINAELTA